MISPGRLLDIQGVGDPVTVAQHNFEVLTQLLFEFTSTYESGVETVLIGPPVAGAHLLDEKWWDAYDALWRCTAAGTPGTWRQETPAVVATEPTTGTIPVGYHIFDESANFRRKYHIGSYVWRSVEQAILSLTSLTGGVVGTDLDAVVTTSLGAGQRAEVLMESIIWDYVLEAGTDAEAVPWVVRPDDYNGASNAKVWKLKMRSTGGDLVLWNTTQSAFQRCQLQGSAGMEMIVFGTPFTLS